jgi:periplasmic divalent cation tolerance protein
MQRISAVFHSSLHGVANPMNEILVLSTVDSPELALRIARAVVEAGEAACANILPGVRSIYRWEGKTCDDQEILLLIKSIASRFEALRAHIRRLHSYQIPEIIAVPIQAGDSDYLRWLAAQTSIEQV